jgi:hypothetical protein
MAASTSPRRCRSNDSESAKKGPTFSLVSSCHLVASARGSSSGVSRNNERSAAACIMPIEMPRPSDGLVQAHASPSGITPVPTGTPSSTNVR